MSLHIYYLIWYSAQYCEVDKVGINFIIITSLQMEILEARECVLCSSYIVQWMHGDARNRIQAMPSNRMIQGHYWGVKI